MVGQGLKRTAPLRVVWPTEAVCALALSDFATYLLSHGMGLLDALIAACAVGLSATLCTFNDKHYRVVPGLVTARPGIDQVGCRQTLVRAASVVRAA